MKQFFITLLALGATISLVACGGSGGGGGTTGGGNQGQLVTFISHTSSDTVAFQDGSGDWKLLHKVGGTSATYQGRVKDPSGKYGFAVKSGVKRDIYHATVAEATEINVSTDRPNYADVRARVDGLTPALPEDDYIQLSGGVAYLQYSFNATFVGPLSLKSDWDAVGVYKVKNGSGIGFDPAQTKYFIYRDLVQSPPDPLDLDLTGPNVLAPEVATIAMSDFSSSFETKNGTLLTVPSSSASNQTTLYALPTASIVSGDRFLFRKNEDTPGSGSSTVYRGSTVATTSPSGLTGFPMPDALTAYSVTAVDAAHDQYLATFQAPSGAAFYRVSLEATHPLTIYVSAGWAGNVSTFSYTTPNLSSIPAFAEGVPVDYTGAELFAEYSNRPFSSFLLAGLAGEMQATQSLPLGTGVIDARSYVKNVAVN